MLPLPNIPKPGITHRQKALALTVAGIADFLQIMLLPAMLPGLVLDEIIDVIVAIILVLVCGFKWQFVLAFFVEIVPGLSLLPTWSAVVLLLPTSAPDPQFFDSDAPQYPPYHQPIPRPAVPHPPITVSAVAIPPVQRPPIQPQP